MARFGFKTDADCDSGDKADQSSTTRRFSASAGTRGVNRVDRRTGVTTAFFFETREGVAAAAVAAAHVAVEVAAPAAVAAQASST